MARRKTSGAEDFVALVARLPWWGGVALAFLGWLIFHRIAATTPAAANVQSGQMAAFLQRSILASVAYALQFVVPLLCLFAALLSWFGRRKRAALVQTVTGSTSADALNGMSWREFEMLVGEAFRLQGYSVSETGGPAPDGGVDLVLRKGSETFLVQCKQWKALKVGVDVVRELYGVMAARGAAGGFVVTSGTFTADAAEFAQGRNVKLVAGTQLHGLIRQARSSISSTPGSAPAPAPARPTGEPAVVAAESAPQCPTCNATMVRRTARKGAAPGTQFWGCSKFPACRGTR